MSSVRYLAAVLALGTATSALAGPCTWFRRGDATGDGEVGLPDVVLTLEYLFKGETNLQCLDAADVDDSGRLDVTDAIYLLLFLFRDGLPPESPWQSGCGTDLTEDSLGCNSHAVCDGPPSQDLSDFDHFEYWRSPPIGSPRTLAAASIDREEGERYLMSLRVFADDGNVVDLPPRHLDSREVEEIRLLSRELRIGEATAGVCGYIGQPPYEDYFAWDAVRVSGFPCSRPWLDNCSSRMLIDFLEGLLAD